ncbi:Rep family protein [Vagococcus fluvialis]|uniref:Rep family protein n=1 Tax=Vagococcus fluvialis TaxID=2738 RepID=UPI003D108341
MSTKKCRNMMFSTQIDRVPYKTAQHAYDFFMSFLSKKPLQIAVILHDKDTDDDGITIKPHLHIMLRFENARSMDQVAKEIGELPQTIEAWNDNYYNGFSYLLHETASAENKHIYDSNEVVANFDFNKEMIKIRTLASTDFKENHLPARVINSLIDEIKEGTKTKEEVEELISGSNLAKYTRKIEAACNYARSKRQQAWHDEMRNKEKKISVFYYYGESGSGKTRFAKEYAKSYSDKVYITGSSNDPFQNYNGEDVIIIDELRHDTFVYSDLLKILDPYNFESMGSSRYHDKALMASTIIITSPYSPNDLYSLIKKNNKNMDSKVDSFKQLARRLSLVTHFSMSYIEIAFYDEKYDKFYVEKASREPNRYSHTENVIEISKKIEFEKEYKKMCDSITTIGRATND